MSYVIQNLIQFDKYVIVTPRVRSLILLNNIVQLLIFFKFGTFLRVGKLFSTSAFNPFLSFYKHFYFFYIFKIYKKINLNLSAAYTNNFKKSLIFYNLTCLKASFTPLVQTRVLLNTFNSFLYNLYFLSIKIINTRLIKLFYKNLFFFFMLNLHALWGATNSSFKFHLNFFFSLYDLHQLKFYNGYFLKIFNF